MSAPDEQEHKALTRWARAKLDALEGEGAAVEPAKPLASRRPAARSAFGDHFSAGGTDAAAGALALPDEVEIPAYSEVMAREQAKRTSNAALFEAMVEPEPDEAELSASRLALVNDYMRGRPIPESLSAPVLLYKFCADERAYQLRLRGELRARLQAAQSDELPPPPEELEAMMAGIARTEAIARNLFYAQRVLTGKLSQ